MGKRVKELKQLAVELGISIDGCLEKADIIKRISEAPRFAAERAHRVFTDSGGANHTTEVVMSDALDGLLGHTSGRAGPSGGHDDVPVAARSPALSVPQGSSSSSVLLNTAGAVL